MRHSIIFFFFTIMFMSCLEYNSHEGSKSEGEIITIHNPINISVNDLILEYDTIRLEAKEDSYIAEISKMEILDNYIYIYGIINKKQYSYSLVMGISYLKSTIKEKDLINIYPLIVLK